MKGKYLFFTDTHLNRVSPWTKYRFIKNILNEDPAGMFITGDISNGLMLILDLEILAYFIKCPIYFVLGNHDYNYSSIDNIHNKIRNLCKKYSNLIWLTESEIVPLSEEVALIGVEGWYDAKIGNPNLLKFTTDWLLIEDFRKLHSLSERIEAFRELSNKSCEIIEKKLNQALELDYKTIYILTHFPCWKESTRDEGTLLEPFWLPYNTNIKLGQTIENIMKDLKRRNVTVLSGHSHCSTYIRVSRNIDCWVGRPNALISNLQKIFI